MLTWILSETTLLAALLVAVIVYDLKYMRLPNVLALLFVVVFAATVGWTLPFGDLIWRIGIGLIVLGVGIVANAARWLGGGDVKILAALVLFFPRADLLAFAFVLCISMIVGIIGLTAIRRALRRSAPTWHGLQQSGKFPMGISIGATGLVMLYFG